MLSCGVICLWTSKLKFHDAVSLFVNSTLLVFVDLEQHQLLQCTVVHLDDLWVRMH